ncbi:MAG: D-alanyl-D-alanine carboxypeptidase family protein [Ferrimicrobium sp.]|uniref:D-alanyl-D-alanine carboxypeptidase family protein n=1 Tax=Ferrimicrobium sp. TaxID=2926050 RepID=UPI00262286BC|nr:hypothetical protein [Ferrimicrobium sp.]
MLVNRLLPLRSVVASLLAAFAALGGMSIVITARLHANLPPLSVITHAPTQMIARGKPLIVKWPPQGQAAGTIPSITPTVIAASANEHPVPIASLAKLMTAHLVLARFPLRLGSVGPYITITTNDVSQYYRDVAQDQSSVQVIAGERLSEYQLLQALLTRSANNIAQLLATWVAGSQTSFVAEMNHEAAKLGLQGTHFSDASGFDPSTRATARAVTVIAAIDMRNRIFDRIVDEHTVTLPVAGTLPNIVARIGTGNVVGIKSGYTIWSGGCAAIAIQLPTRFGTRQAIGVVLGQQGPNSLHRAASLAEGLATQLSSGVTDMTAVRQDQVVGSLRIPWLPKDHHLKLIAAKTLDLAAWPGQKVTYHLHLNVKNVVAGISLHTVVGYLSVVSPSRSQLVPIITSQKVPVPGAWWRLVHG